MNCPFCLIVSHQSPAHIVFEDSDCMAFLDKYPKAYGHTLLIPKKHVRWIYEIGTMGEIFSLAGRIIRGIIPILGADHVTIGTYGHEVEHAHIWIVPRYSRDGRVRFPPHLPYKTEGDLSLMMRKTLG